MKVLLSAYACSPGAGSELEVGWRTLLAAASRHEVWLLTQRPMAEAVERGLTGHPAAGRIHVEAVDPPAPSQEPGLGATALRNWRHDQWQRRAGARAIELDKSADFDVVHHVTLAAYWMRTGVAALNKPLVWGPVGGAVEPPLRLLGELGAKGLAGETARTLMRRIASHLPAVRATRKRASVIFVQNQETQRRLASAPNVIMLSNALSVDLEEVPASTGRTKEIVFVGRLEPWKAPRLAVRAMRYVSDPDATLHIFWVGHGDEERRRILEAAKRWGVAGRVRLEGTVPRERLLERLASAAVLLHPSLHDEGGTAIAEALTLGAPVIYFDRGGPREVARQWPKSPSVAVTPGWPDETARRLASAVDGFLADPPAVPHSPLPPRQLFADRILEAYEQALHRSAAES